MSDDLSRPVTVALAQGIEGKFLDDDWLDEVLRYEAAKILSLAQSTRPAARLH